MIKQLVIIALLTLNATAQEVAPKPPRPHPPQPAEVFKRADVDKDGFLSAEEFKSVMQRLQKQRQQERPSKQPPTPKRKRQGPRDQ
jgi:hypothetical protein